MNRVRERGCHNWDRGSSVLCCNSLTRGGRQDDLGFKPHQLLGEGRQPFRIAISVTVDHIEVAALNVSEISHPLQEGVHKAQRGRTRTPAQPSNQWRRGRDLAACPNRPRHRAAKEPEDISASHGAAPSSEEALRVRAGSLGIKEFCGSVGTHQQRRAPAVHLKSCDYDWNVCCTWDRWRPSKRPPELHDPRTAVGLIRFGLLCALRRRQIALRPLAVLASLSTSRATQQVTPIRQRRRLSRATHIVVVVGCRSGALSARSPEEAQGPSSYNRLVMRTDPTAPADQCPQPVKADKRALETDTGFDPKRKSGGAKML